MLKAKIHSAHRLLFGFTVIAVVTALAFSSRLSATSPLTCTGGPLITGIESGEVVSGVVDLSVYAPSHLNAQKVTFETSDSFIGQATKVDANNWSLSWNSNSLPSQTVEIYARLSSDSASNGTNESCITQPVEILVENSDEQADLAISLNRTAWAGPTSVNTQFEAQANLLTADSDQPQIVTEQARFKWSTDIGAIHDHGDYSVFSSGPFAGTGEVRVTVSYGGQTRHAVIDAIVFAQDSGSTYPFNSNSFGETEGTLASEEGNQETASYGDEKLEACLRSNLAGDFDALIDRGGRLSYSQLSQVEGCLSAHRFVLPANLAPLDPVKVSQLTQDSVLSVAEPTQATDQQGVKTEGIVLSGTVNPGSSVLLFIFSEPLVAMTESDSSGNWTYTLEEPLAPGQHEVYAVVESGEEFVRSEGVSFSLKQSSSTELNPDGLSLSLDSADGVVGYGLAIGAVLTLAVALVMLVIHRQTQVYHKHAPKPEKH